MNRYITNKIFYAFMFAQSLWDLRNVVTVHDETYPCVRFGWRIF